MIELSKNELRRIQDQIDEDYEYAISAHRERMARFARYYRMWRNSVPPENSEGSDDDPNFQVPLLQWHCFAKLAQLLDSILGDDAEVIATPSEDTDDKQTKKISAFMQWLVFNAMKITKPLTEWIQRGLLNGKSYAYVPWHQQTYTKKVTDPDGNPALEDVMEYDLPKMFALWPDDLIVPPGDVDSIQDYRFVIRQFRASVQDLLQGERQELYSNVSVNLEKLIRHSEGESERAIDERNDDVKFERNEAEGVDYDASPSGPGRLRVWEWFGRRRLPRVDIAPDLATVAPTTELDTLDDTEGLGLMQADVDAADEADPQEWDVERRDQNETELRVYYLPDLNLIIGVHDLAEQYPSTSKRRPFIEFSIVKDGSSWPMGLGEMLETIQDESSALHNQFMTAGEMAIGPVLIARPGSGFDPKQNRYRPWSVLWSNDPAGVTTIQSKVDPSYFTIMQQALLGHAERADSVSDQTLGRTIDRPNAPRTATQSMALIEQSNIRVSLDLKMLRYDLTELLEWIWKLVQMFAPEELFFRVTAEDPDGLLEIGRHPLSTAERQHNFDFSLRFATSIWSREADKERFLQAYPLLLNNPIVAQNPALLQSLAQQLCRKLGLKDLARLFPPLPQPDAPMDPNQEWARMQQGEDIDPNPNDNDDFHAVKHDMQIARAERAAAAGQYVDEEALLRLKAHRQLHDVQRDQKRMRQALVGALVKNLAPAEAQAAAAMPDPAQMQIQGAPQQ